MMETVLLAVATFLTGAIFGIALMDWLRNIGRLK